MLVLIVLASLIPGILAVVQYFDSLEKEKHSIFKLIDNNLIVGYYSYIFENEKIVKLDNLFILPEYIGRGFGKYLILDFLNRMKEDKIERITLDSEPNAEDFYSKIGFVKVGEFETSIKNRFMPIMEMNL